MFRDRSDAGRQLGRALARFQGERPVVIALPRGGVPVGYEVAKALGAPLDVAVVRKIGHPASPELAIGAVADCDEPRVVLDRASAEASGATEAQIEAAITRAKRELARRERSFAAHRPGVSLKGRVAIVVDDGVATGYTMRAALQHVRAEGASRVVMAVPVAPTEALIALRPECDLVVCLREPSPFRAVGLFYEDFAQMSDEEVVAILDRARGAKLELRVLGIHPVPESPWPCWLLECSFLGVSKGDEMDVYQDLPRGDAQHAWDHQRLSDDGTQRIEWTAPARTRERVAFFLHLIDVHKPVSWRGLKIQLPPVTEMPARLRQIVRYRVPD